MKGGIATDTLRTAGRRGTLYGAILVFFWSLYELMIRADTMVKTLDDSLLRLYRDRVINLGQTFYYFPWKAMKEPLILVSLIILALLAFLLRKRRWPHLFVLILSCGEIALLILSPALFAWKLFDLLKLASLAALALGSLLTLIYLSSRQKNLQKIKNDAPPPEGYNPFGIR